MAVLHAGQIVLADWRDALPKEPTRLRPAIVVEDDRLFPDDYQNVILVPLSEDGALAPPDVSLVIDPTTENGCTKRCYALSHCVATTSLERVTPTSSRVTPDQLRVIRYQIALAIGIDLD
ncbi:MAG TPA: type II toxin-antitoxin system PemK/MazF family toxin [Stellaceae bacterium]|nr:type II toxin-antitoxin system PemK/MazF family toxin [Stellaceae bacterium]